MNSTMWWMSCVLGRLHLVAGPLPRFGRVRLLAGVQASASVQAPTAD
jgi:hypothetical protein